MARFLKHVPCPKCGSSDANALYDDGSSWCFSCNSLGGTARAFHKRNTPRETGHHRLPDDCSSHFVGPAVHWVSKYDIPIETLLKHNVCYSPWRNQVIFRFPPTDLWQARNLNPGSKSKYFTSGDHSGYLPIYFCGTSVDTCVIVEDCLSAIKIASSGHRNGLWCDAMPLLGSALPTNKMNALRRHYKTLIFWLDHDKGANAQRYARQAGILGLETKCIFTELDPKEYDYDKIKELVLA